MPPKKHYHWHLASLPRTTSMIMPRSYCQSQGRVSRHFVKMFPSKRPWNCERKKMWVLTFDICYINTSTVLFSSNDDVFLFTSYLRLLWTFQIPAHSITKIASFRPRCEVLLQHWIDDRSGLAELFLSYFVILLLCLFVYVFVCLFACLLACLFCLILELNLLEKTVTILLWFFDMTTLSYLYTQKNYADFLVGKKHWL